MEETSFDPRRRRLCPDGACIGLIGDDGRCKVCGKAASGSNLSAVPRGADDDAHVDDNADGTDEALTEDRPSTAFASGAGESVEASAGFDPNRRLCEDGSCVGVVGANGHCSVCGRRAE